MSNVRKIGPGKWRSQCPAHMGEGRSLQISEGREGAVLVWCWAHECSIHDIAAAVGVQVADLMGDRPLEGRKPHEHRGRPDPREQLRSVRPELLVVLMCAEQLQRGKPLNMPDQARMNRACRIITTIADRAA